VNKHTVLTRPVERLSKIDSRIVLGVAKPDAWSSPFHSPLLPVLVGKGESALRPKEALPVREIFDVEVVQHDVFGIVVPVVQVEKSAEVHVSSKRSGPSSLSHSRFTDEDERQGSRAYLETTRVRGS